MVCKSGSGLQSAKAAASSGPQGTAASGLQKQQDTSRQNFYSQGGSVRAIQIGNFSRNLGRTSVNGPGQWLQTAVRDSGGGQWSVIAAAKGFLGQQMAED